MKGIIYKATNIKNGKVYVGKSARTLEIRKAEHLRKASKYSPNPFYKALYEYGAEAFKWEVIEEIEVEDRTTFARVNFYDLNKELTIAEAKHIELLKSYLSKKGYNVRAGVTAERKFDTSNRPDWTMAVYNEKGRRIDYVLTLKEAKQKYGLSAMHVRVLDWYNAEDGVAADCTANTKYAAVKFPPGVKPPIKVKMEFRRPLSREDKAFFRRVQLAKEARIRWQIDRDMQKCRKLEG